MSNAITCSTGPLAFFGHGGALVEGSSCMDHLIRELQRKTDVVCIDVHREDAEHKMGQIATQHPSLSLFSSHPHMTLPGERTKMPNLIKMALAIPHVGEAVPRLRRALHEVQPRAMWVDDERALLIAWLAAPSELPLAYFVRSELRSIRPYCAPAWCRVDAALGVSKHSLRYLRSTSYAHRNLHVVGNGIDVDRTLEQAGMPALVQGRDASAVRVACPVLLPRPLKGHQIGMLAVGDLNRMGGRAELRLCAGARSVRSLGDQVSALASDLGVQEHVRTLDKRQDVLSAMAGSDVVLFPCPVEDHLQLVLGAMALGKPIVAVRTGTVPELICDGVDGILVPPGDVQATVNALGALLEPGARERIGAAGQRRARQRFSLGQQATRFVRAIDALAKADWISRGWLLSPSAL